MRQGAGARHFDRSRQDSACSSRQAQAHPQQIPGNENCFMSILAIGSVAFDCIASPAGSADNVLGGSATYFALAASYFTEVRIVAVVGEDFTAQHEQVFKSRGIDT